MTTVVHGCSDDYVIFSGDLGGELHDLQCHDGTSEVELLFSDGTHLLVRYPKRKSIGVWGIEVLKAGPLFDHIDPCEDENAKLYSDVAYFTSGLTGCMRVETIKLTRNARPIRDALANK